MSPVDPQAGSPTPVAEGEPAAAGRSTAAPLPDPLPASRGEGDLDHVAPAARSGPPGQGDLDQAAPAARSGPPGQGDLDQAAPAARSGPPGQGDLDQAAPAARSGPPGQGDLDQAGRAAPDPATEGADRWAEAPVSLEDVRLTPKLPDPPAPPPAEPPPAPVPPPAPPVEGWWTRARRALTRWSRTARPRRGVPPARASRRASPASPARPPAPARTAPPQAESADGFAPFGRLLRIEVPIEPAPLAADDEAGDAALAARILELFAAAPLEQASFPAVATEILALVSSPDVEVGRLAATLSRDPALSAGIISVASSPAFRGLSEVETVREAVTRLGLQEVGRVAVAVATRTLFDAGTRARTPLGQRSRALFERSVAVGACAAAAAMRQRGARSDRVYLGGLLHDVGKALALGALARGGPADGGAEPEPARLERVLDRVHLELGAAAHRAWALPQYLTAMCEHHHDGLAPAGDAVDLHLVRLASALATLRDPPFAARAARELVESAAVLRLDPYAVRALAAELRQAEQRAAALPR